MKHISRNMARDIHNAPFYIISIFCKSAISLKGLGKLGLLINEAPRQVSDLLDLAVLLSRACRLGCGTEMIQWGGLWSQHNCELLSKWWKALTGAAGWLALKVSARNSVSLGRMQWVKKLRDPLQTLVYMCEILCYCSGRGLRHRCIHMYIMRRRKGEKGRGEERKRERTLIGDNVSIFTLFKKKKKSCNIINEN